MAISVKLRIFQHSEVIEYQGLSSNSMKVAAARLKKFQFFNYPSQVLFLSCEQAFPARPHTDIRDTVGPDSILTVVLVVVEKVLDGDGVGVGCADGEGQLT